MGIVPTWLEKDANSPESRGKVMNNDDNQNHTYTHTIVIEASIRRNTNIRFSVCGV